MAMDATTKSFDSIARDLRFMTSKVNNLPTSDFEAVDAINAALRDIKAELEALQLSLAPNATEDLSLPEAA